MTGTTSPKGSPRFGFGGRSSRAHSTKSSLSGQKVNLTETHEEKVQRNLKSKADPTIAMSESQPIAVALEKSNLGSLRDIQHKDQYGNIITDPDLSNPTRPRFERPLDTIRSFEAAIRGTYGVSNSSPSRSASYSRDDMSQRGWHGRHKDSYYGGYNGPSNGYVRGYNDQGRHYGGRGHQSRPDSYIDNYMGPNESSTYNYSRGPRYQYPPMNQEQPYGNGNGDRNDVSQNPCYPPEITQNTSYDSSATASGSNTESWGNASTNPSSVDSTMYPQQHPHTQQTHLTQSQPQAITDNYGFDFGTSPHFGENTFQPETQDSRDGSGFYSNINNNNNNAAKTPGAISTSSPNPGSNPAVGDVAQSTTGSRKPGKKGLLRRTTKDSEASQGKEKKGWFKKKFSRS